MIGKRLRQVFGQALINQSILFEKKGLQVGVIQAMVNNAKGVNEKALPLVEKQFFQTEGTEAFAFPEGLHASLVVGLFGAQTENRSAFRLPYFLFFCRKSAMAIAMEGNFSLGALMCRVSPSSSTACAVASPNAPIIASPCL